MIEIRVYKRFGSFQLAAEFAVPESGVIAFFGRSGSGKTSLINTIAGIARPDEGRIRIGDRTFFDSDAGLNLPIERRDVGYVFQDSRLFPHLTVESNLKYGLKRTRGRSQPIDFDTVVGLLDILPVLGRRPHTLSGGERQRVALGRALLAQPRLLLMDEPLASLDAPRKAEILPYIERLRDEFRLPIIYVSHAIEEIVRLADHVVALSDGKVEAAGPLQDIMARPELAPILGRFEAGAMIDCTVVRHDVHYGLSVLAFADGQLRVPLVDLPEGMALRVRVRARDVSLALSRPMDVSIANRLPGEVVEIFERESPYADVVVNLGQTRVRALITRESVDRLALQVGVRVWAMVKTVAFDGRALGLRRSLRDEKLPPPAAEQAPSVEVDKVVTLRHDR